MITLDSKVPSGPLDSKWDRHRFSEKLVSPSNKRSIGIIVVGTGLAGASAASTL
jgi:succinate dehydrogenase flavoprotein subunit